MRRGKASIRYKNFSDTSSPSHPPISRKKSRGRLLGTRFPKREKKRKLRSAKRSEKQPNLVRVKFNFLINHLAKPNDLSKVQ